MSDGGKYLTLTMGDDQPVWGREELGTVLALIETREMGKWAVYAFAAHLARSLGVHMDDRDQAAADAVRMASQRLGEHIEATAEDSVHGPYQRIGCATCDACQAVIDRWGKP